MSDLSRIEWTDATWNPVTGCTKVSPGCAHCYIERTPPFRIAGRKFVRGTTGVQLHPERLDAPLRWKAPRRVFVNSLSDLFHEDVPFAFIDQVFGAMALTPQHTYQVLTKRPTRMLAYMQDLRDADRDYAAERIHKVMQKFDLWPDISEQGFATTGEWPLLNVWLGVSVENQRWADERIPLLLATPASVRFVSCEPLLGPVDLWRPYAVYCQREYGGFRHIHKVFEVLPPLDWVIVGGESGPGARVMDLAWARSLREQCASSGVPFFMKQLGGKRPGSELGELPEDLRVREFPR